MRNGPVGLSPKHPQPQALLRLRVCGLFPSKPLCKNKVLGLPHTLALQPLNTLLSQVAVEVVVVLTLEVVAVVVLADIELRLALLFQVVPQLL